MDESGGQHGGQHQPSRACRCRCGSCQCRARTQQQAAECAGRGADTQAAPASPRICPSWRPHLCRTAAQEPGLQHGDGLRKKEFSPLSPPVRVQLCLLPLNACFIRTSNCHNCRIWPAGWPGSLLARAGQWPPPDLACVHALPALQSLQRTGSLCVLCAMQPLHTHRNTRARTDAAVRGNGSCTRATRSSGSKQTLG